MPLPPVPGDLYTPAEPDILVVQGISDEAFQAGHLRWPPSDTAMQAHAHHLRTLLTLGIEHVEGVLQIGEELLAGVQPRAGEPHVVGLQRVGHNQLLMPSNGRPKRKIVGVVVGVVEKAPVLGDEPARVGAGAAGVPAQRPLAGQAAVDLDRAHHVLALDPLRHVLVVDPAPAVRGDLVAAVQHGVDRRGVALQRHGDAEHRHRHAVALEQPQQPPDPGAGAVFVDLLHAHVPRADHRGGIDHVGEEGLGGRIAVQHRGLGPLLVVEHQLDRDTSAARPVGMGRVLAIADHVAGVGVGHV